jgi:hypothetical protein
MTARKNPAIGVMTCPPNQNGRLSFPSGPSFSRLV